ncbi:protein-lysine N-trimethyltransferase SMYD5 [Onthophagus taurus]|uniref:protein-lysine N-trimethyltransferase SMYD5 n=1 Tax=Onthophagus taurus TaxID=166361 RepID=UPI000C20CC55|nr:SET and MYND domain-containing protein 5 [Onthophagus taurus]
MENVEIRLVNNSKGRGLFAKKSFKSGDVIFEETPFVCCQFSWNSEYKYKACDYCLKPLETAQENARRLTGQPNLELPFPDCCTTDKSKIVLCFNCNVEYCSEECKMNSWNDYHKMLCVGLNTTHPLINLNNAWKQIHYPPEESTIMILPRILAMIEQSENREQVLLKLNQFCNKSVNEELELAHKFLGDKFIGSINLLYDLLKNVISQKEIDTIEGFHKLLAILGTNGQGVGTSSISEWVNKCSELPLSDFEREKLNNFIDKLYVDMENNVGCFLNNEGVALYSLQSAANHSCIPNAEPSFLHNNSKLSLVALKDIQDGEEICISYLDECNLGRSRHSRHKQLAENYLFICNCEKCLQEINEADVTSEESDEDMSD